MKRIETIIRNSQLKEVRSSLHKLGVEFITYNDIVGIGKEKSSNHFKVNEYETRIIPRVNISFLFEDEFVDNAVDTIIKAASDKEQGDGKIYISTIDELVNIQSGR
ncbi:MAG: P-II family nitrogen regulator [Vallitaleaceae bacterium]|jgi:nitrogen regulatory protein P-II 1|nr:P-II family nitrogen regulator [Vallitaleaceae bacterium]